MLALTPAAGRRAPATALERLAWAGLIAGLLLCASAASLGLAPPPPAAVLLVGAFGPADLTGWAQAICGAIGALTAALNGVAIVWHRWGKPPRKPRRRAAAPDDGPHDRRDPPGG
jgi:hypothetical protein